MDTTITQDQVKALVDDVNWIADKATSPKKKLAVLRDLYGDITGQPEEYNEEYPVVFFGGAEDDRWEDADYWFIVDNRLFDQAKWEDLPQQLVSHLKQAMLQIGLCMREWNSHFTYTHRPYGKGTTAIKFDYIHIR